MMAEWTERYNVHTLSLVKEGEMDIVVDWGRVSNSRLGIGYQITFNGIRRYGKNIDDLKEAKQAGLQFAEEVLEGAIAEIQEKRNHAGI